MNKVVKTLLILWGLFNVSNAGYYYITTWKSLASQGITNFYLILTTIIGFFFSIVLPIAASFLGSLGMSEDYKDRSVWFRALATIGGCILAFFLPQLILTGWFIAITWLRTML